MSDPAFSRDVAVIGAGPAGLMAGMQAAARGLAVAVFEREPEPCLRLLKSGGGDAPVSNTRLDVSGFGGRHSRFVSDALVALPMDALKGWFSDQGLSLHNAEHYGHVLADGGGPAVRDALLQALEQAGAELYADVVISRAHAANSGFELTVDGELVKCRSLVLATGPGETGHALARQLGHEVLAGWPAHAGLRTEAGWLDPVAGLWMDVRATLHGGGKGITRHGSMQFQAGALTGEVIYNLSGHLSGLREPELEVNFYPDLSDEDVAEWLHRTLGGATREFAPAALDRMLPMPLAKAFLAQLNVKDNARAMHLELRDRQGLLKLMTGLRVPVTGTLNPETRFGGVAVRQVDPRTFASRVTRGLFIAGEVLDIQPDWGGFGTHFALASGMLAGRHA